MVSLQTSHQYQAHLVLCSMPSAAKYVQSSRRPVSPASTSPLRKYVHNPWLPPGRYILLCLQKSLFGNRQYKIGYLLALSVHQLSSHEIWTRGHTPLGPPCLMVAGAPPGSPDCFDKSKSESIIWPDWCRRISGIRSISAFAQEYKRRTFRFKIPVDVSVQMKILQRGNHFRSVEFSVFLWKTFIRTSLEGSKKLSSHAILPIRICSEARKRLTSRTKKRWSWDWNEWNKVTINGWFEVARISCSANALLILLRLIISFFDKTGRQPNGSTDWSVTAHLSSQRAFQSFSPWPGRPFQRRLYPTTWSSGMN